MPTFLKKISRYVLVTALLFITFTGYLKAVSNPAIFGVGGESIEEEIGSLNLDLKSRRQEIEDLKLEAEDMRQKLINERGQGVSLKRQISILDTQIAKSKIEIKTKEQEIELTELDIKETERNIAAAKVRIDEQKERIAEIIRIIYQNKERSYLEILLMNDSFSEFFKEVSAIEGMHLGLSKQLEELKFLQDTLETELLALNEKKDVLKKQKKIFQDKKYKLEQQELVKNQLLDETKRNERTFFSLLSQLKGEQNSINAEIVSLEKTIRKKLEEQEKSAVLNSTKGEKFIWPVTKNTITSYFHDPDYPYRYIFEHPAIDIRAKQRSPVVATASGYVAKARKDLNCTGRYSYIMIIHAGGLSSVYGHLNSISVDEGQFVVQGQKIGLSGAMPGTCGSGRLTTGPHLHFEVRSNGIPVDPLGYLR